MVLVGLLVLGTGYWLFRDSLHEQAVAGTAFGARTVCSCRYVGGREMASCKADFEPGMDVVFISEDEEEQEITAWVPLLASQSARLVPGFGCVLDGWQG